MVSRQDCSAIVALVGSSSAPCLGDLAKKKSSNLAFPQLDKLTMVSFFFCISAAQISSVGLYVSFGVKSCKSRLGELQVSYLIDYSIRSQIVVAVNFLNYV
jgi:hypothetical protein